MDGSWACWAPGLPSSDSRDEDWYPLTLTSLMVGPGRCAA